MLPVAYHHREVPQNQAWSPVRAWKLRLRSLAPVSQVTIKFPEDVLTRDGKRILENFLGF